MSSRHPIRVLLVTIPALLAARSAHAQVEARAPSSARFGTQGQLVLGGASNVGVSSTTYDSTEASNLRVVFSPNLDYFVLANLSIGLDIDLSYTDSKGYGADSSLVETKTTSLGAGPRFGWNIPLGESLSWWLTGTLGLESIQTTQSLPNGGGTISVASSAGAPSTSKVGPYIDAYAPLLLHPVPHFFLGAGPSIFHEFAALQGGPNVGDQRTSYGASFVVGGYWGGEPTPTAAPLEPPPDSVPAHTRRFGDHGGVVFTNELLLSTSSTAYAGTVSSDVNGGLTIGFDYFLVDHVSFGVAVYGSFDNASGLDANGNTVTNDQTTYGFLLRFGVQIPVEGRVSFYPRASVGVGGGSANETSVAGQDAYSLQEDWVSGYVPLVVEVAPHFIAGFGPSISRDFVNTATFAQGQQFSNNGTTIGASFLVGGWL
jgi:hypothetical protein